MDRGPWGAIAVGRLEHQSSSRLPHLHTTTSSRKNGENSASARYRGPQPEKAYPRRRASRRLCLRPTTSQSTTLLTRASRRACKGLNSTTTINTDTTVLIDEESSKAGISFGASASILCPWPRWFVPSHFARPSLCLLVSCAKFLAVRPCLPPVGRAQAT